MQSKVFSNCFKTVRTNVLFSYKLMFIGAAQFFGASGEVVTRSKIDILMSDKKMF